MSGKQNMMHIRSEPAIFRKLYRKIIKTFLDIVIMKELNDGSPMSGHDVIRFIHKKHNLFMSSGTIYSLLFSLERNGLIKGQKTQRKRIYKLTSQGEENLKNVLNAEEEIQTLVTKVLPSARG
jgi:DNA-binding PadR family transcriptional regulator